MDGFINLLKPAGMTSHDVVSALRKILRTKKIGHTGTLDPMAAGVLPVCVGRATRAAEYLESDRKAYRCELLLGASSDTGDIWGDVSFEEGPADEVCADRERVRSAVLSVLGTQEQYPPMYSAVRKDGKHLYEYAREGISVEVEPITITVFRVEPVFLFHEPRRVIFDIECSKGTYIRTICEEIGRRLGCGAVMTFLVRTRSGAFSIGESVTLEELLDRVAGQEQVSREDILKPGGRRSGEREADVSDFLVPIGEMLSGFGTIVLDEEERRKYANGGKLSLRNVRLQSENRRNPGDRFCDMYRVFGEDGSFVGTAKFDGKKKIFTPGKVFYR